MDARGLLNRFIVRSIYPKTVDFESTYDMKGLTCSTHHHDRRLFQRLTRDDFAAVARRVQDAVTDEVIERAIARLPAEWREQTNTAPRLRSALRGRGDAFRDARLETGGRRSRVPDLARREQPGHAAVDR